MNINKFFTHRLANLFETAIIMAALFSILISIAWLFAGKTGILLLCIAGVPALIFGGAQAGWLVLRMYRAKQLTTRSAPDLLALVAELSRRAELPNIPALFYIPSTDPLAFSVGFEKNGAIALSDGLIRLLSWREVIGVVAHEVSHIAGSDIRVMGIADVASRMVSAISLAGQILLIFNLPLYILNEASLPLLPLFIMMLAPLIMTLLQLALSRSREYEADRFAARLTGDPLGLASALERLGKFQHLQLRRLFIPYGKVEVPSVLRTHPGTNKRIERLVDLAQERESESGISDIRFETPYQILRGVEAPTRSPRRWFSGVWY
jgi:heat shock protein HtpX